MTKDSECTTRPKCERRTGSPLLAPRRIKRLIAAGPLGILSVGAHVGGVDAVIEVVDQKVRVPVGIDHVHAPFVPARRAGKAQAAVALAALPVDGQHLAPGIELS